MHVFPREPFFKHVTHWVIWCLGFIQLAKGTDGTHRRNDKQGEGWWRASNLHPTLRTSPSLFASTARELLWLNVTSHSGNGALVHTSMNFNVTLQCDHLAQTVSLCQNCDKPTCSVPLWPHHGKSAQQTSKEKERYSTWTYNFYQMFIIFRSAYSSVRAWLPHLNEDEGSSLREAFQEFAAIHIC